MADNRSFLQKFQLLYRRSHPLTKAVVAAAIVLSTVTLVALRTTQWDAQKKLAALQEEAAALAQSNASYAQRIGELGTDTAIRQIAAEELGLVDPDLIIIEESE